MLAAVRNVIVMRSRAKTIHRVNRIQLDKCRAHTGFVDFGKLTRVQLGHATAVSRALALVLLLLLLHARAVTATRAISSTIVQMTL